MQYSGLDFMISHNVKVDVRGMVMNINGKSCSLTQAGKIGCYRVTVSEQVVVPGRSEVTCGLDRATRTNWRDRAIRLLYHVK